MKDWKDRIAMPEPDSPGVAIEAAEGGDGAASAPELRRLSDYLALSGSTTYFFERLAGRRVSVQVLEQRAQQDPHRGEVLHRRSRLYLDAPSNALLIADVEVLLDRLAPDERLRVLRGHEGLGRLLDPDNRGRLRKRDLEQVWLPTPPLLCVGDTRALARTFELLIDDLSCAWIREIVSPASLARLG
jgi:chorismate-pyruvate lyase